MNANGWQAFCVLVQYTTDSHSPPRSDNPNMRYLRGARKKTKGAPTSIRRHRRVIDLRRHATRTATAVERTTAHVHSHVRAHIAQITERGSTMDHRGSPWINHGSTTQAMDQPWINHGSPMISSPARGCLSTPQRGNVHARPGPPLGRIGTYEQHQARS